MWPYVNPRLKARGISDVLTSYPVWLTSAHVSSSNPVTLVVALADVSFSIGSIVIQTIETLKLLRRTHTVTPP